MTGQVLRVIGLMSGTSLDGIDAACLATDGHRIVGRGPWLTMPYPPEFRARLQAVLGGQGDVAGVERDLTEAHVAAVRKLIADPECGAVDLIGFHGHTILHDPGNRRTWQIGDGNLLAALIGIDVVCDFRSADVAAGGEGAPFAPLYHKALASELERPLAVLNIGGVANVTWIGAGEDQILAYDTGPGNALLDDWALTHTGRAVDVDGALAGQGHADTAAVASFLAHPYFARRPPKSLDRDDFVRFRPNAASPADGAATLAAMTVASIATASRHFPAPVRRWLVTGGGRHNPVLMAMLAAQLSVPVSPVEAVGWDGDALEAQAFAYLAVRSLEGLPLSVPSTTGVSAPITGGRLCPAQPPK